MTSAISTPDRTEADSMMPLYSFSYVELTLFPRPLQRDVIVAALDGNDVFVQAATSFGKSLCFQLPALIDHGSEPFLSISSRAWF
jgi:hypothetical protein